MAARAQRWRGLLERRRVRPSLEGSVERLLHDAGIDCGVLDLRGAACSTTSARNG
ncbi:MAG TPA: hypothetical protein VHF51_00215 [Solirubrobacteraceae bacterium]|nr:hypothetical protein [Solirubrobacteraceae bacterium]